MNSTLNKDNRVGAVEMELSKAFNMLNYNLFPCKPKVYGFDTTLNHFHSKLFFKYAPKNKIK